MLTLDFKLSGRRKSFDESEQRLMRHHTWVALATAAIGAGTAVYGASQQKKANQQAQAANAALQDKQNQSAWDAWVMTRGIAPDGSAPGVLPTNGRAVNTRLPLWANVSTTPGGKLALTTSPSSRLTGGTGDRTWAGLGLGSSAAMDAATASPTASKADTVKRLLDPKKSPFRPDKLLTNPLGIFG